MSQTDTGSAVETESAIQGAAGSVTEAYAAADTQTNVLTTSESTSETGTATDTISSAKDTFVSQTDSNSAADLVSGGASTDVAATDGLASADTSDRSRLVVASEDALVDARDTLSNIVSFSGIAADAVLASDTFTNTLNAEVSQSEREILTESAAGSYSTLASMIEAGFVTATESGVKAVTVTVSDSLSSVTANGVLLGANVRTADTLYTLDIQQGIRDIVSFANGGQFTLLFNPATGRFNRVMNAGRGQFVLTMKAALGSEGRTARADSGTFRLRLRNAHAVPTILNGVRLNLVGGRTYDMWATDYVRTFNSGKVVQGVHRVDRVSGYYILLRSDTQFMLDPQFSNRPPLMNETMDAIKFEYAKVSSVQTMTGLNSSPQTPAIVDYRQPGQLAGTPTDTGIDMNLPPNTTPGFVQFDVTVEIVGPP